MEKNAHQIIYDYIREMIASQQLKIGDVLLPERELAKMFGLSRNSVRESLRALSLIGIIDCRQGSGNYISERFCSVEAESLFLTAKLCNVSTQDITDYRCVIECGGVQFAARNRTEQQLKELDRCVAKMRGSLDESGYIINSTVLNEEDKRFHNILAVASGNKFIQTSIEALALVMKEYVNDVWNKIWQESGYDNSEVAALRLQEMDIHQRIVDAVRNRAPEAGEAEMQAHFNMVRRFI